MPKFTEEQIKYLEGVIVFTENGKSIKEINGNVWGDVKGYVGGHVRGDVKHTCQRG